MQMALTVSHCFTQVPQTCLCAFFVFVREQQLAQNGCKYTENIVLYLIENTPIEDTPYRSLR